MRFSVFLLGLSTLMGCAPSEEDVKREFSEEVARSNACEQASDCVSVSPGCPLGCYVAVNVAHRERVERKARELIEGYESWGRQCAYECIEPPEITCVDHKCQQQ